MSTPLHRRLFGNVKTDALHLLLVGNSISLAPGLVAVLRTGVPGHWLTWASALLQLVAVAMLATMVLLEVREWCTRADRRRFFNIPWPTSFPE
jgi:hypothetical protein